MFATRLLLQIQAGVWSHSLLSGALRYCSVAPQVQSEQIQPATQSLWTPSSRRVGAIAIKLGMSHVWLTDGRHVPVTLLQVRIITVCLVSCNNIFKGCYFYDGQFIFSRMIVLLHR